MEISKRDLSSDEVFNLMNKKFISLNSPDEKIINEQLKLVLDKLILAMKSKSPLFKKTYQRIAYTGSYFKKTRVGAPEEFDLNLIINFRLKEGDFEFRADYPGYIKIRTTWGDADVSKRLNLTPEEYKEIKSLIDSNSYLNQNKLRAWIEGILSNVATNRNKEILLDGIKYPVYIKKKSGPAFTLSFTPIGKPIDIDLVPALAFPITNPPPGFRKNSTSYNSNRFWYAVPKPLCNKEGNELYWRLSFYELEKDLLDNYGIANRMKPIIRHLKKFRDTQKFKSIASYYIETLCLHERDIFTNSTEPFTFLFFTMLEKLRDAFENQRINFFWNANVNLLEKLSDAEKNQIKCRLIRIIRDIKLNIKQDKFAIAKYVLLPDELSQLHK